MSWYYFDFDDYWESYLLLWDKIIGKIENKMIIKRTVEKDIYGRGPVEDCQYFGKDAEEFLKSIKWDKSINYLGKECTIDKGLQGIIVGIEDCNSFCDYYYIVYVPESKQVMYELANSADFVKTIKI